MNVGQRFRAIIQWVLLFLVSSCSNQLEENNPKIQKNRQEKSCPEGMNLEDGFCVGFVPPGGFCPVGTREIHGRCSGIPDSFIEDDSDSQNGEHFEDSDSLHGAWELHHESYNNKPTPLYWQSSSIRPIKWFFGKRLLGHRIQATGKKDLDSAISYHLEKESSAHCGFWYPQLKIDEKTGIISGTPHHFGSTPMDFATKCSVKIKATVGDQEISSQLVINLSKCINCKVTTKFSVLNYSPFREGQSPIPSSDGNHPTLEEIEEDLAEIQQLTDNIRIYGQNPDIMVAAQKIGMGVHLGVYLNGENPEKFSSEVVASNKLINKSAIDELIALANKPEYRYTIRSLIVGNEVKLHDYLDEEDLGQYINFVRAKTSYRFPVTSGMIIGPGTPGKYGPSKRLGESMDVVLYHHYPFWERRPAESAHHSIELGYRFMKSRFPEKQVVLGETGWATQGGSEKTSVASEDKQAIFINDLFKLINQSSDSDMKELGKNIMFFQAFDEPWKIQNNEGGELAAHWGLYDKVRNPKKYLRLAFEELYQ